MHYVYIIRSIATGRYYIGSSTNWENRLRQHNMGRVRFTRAYVPWAIVRVEELPDRPAALKREYQIKSYKGGDAFKKLISE